MKLPEKLNENVVLIREHVQHLEKGARSVLNSQMGFQPRPVHDVHVEWNPDDDKLARLEALYGRRDSLTIPQHGGAQEEVMVYRRTLHLLREAFAYPYTPWGTLGIKVAISDWLEKVPREFLDLLCEHRPEALVLLAHIACLLKCAERFWYMKGAGERIVRTVVNLLDEEWIGWIQWPLEFMGNGEHM